MGWPPHGVKGSKGAQVITELAPLENDPVFKLVLARLVQAKLQADTRN